MALQQAVAGKPAAVGSGEFRAGIETGQQLLGNRAFVRWVQESLSAGRNTVEQAMATPLQMMPRKKKKQGAAGPEAGAEPEGKAVPELVTAQPELPPACADPAPVKTVGAGAAGETQEAAASGHKKKRRKSRVQSALNALREEGVEAFRGFIEAEIAERELLETLWARVKRAQDLTSISNDALRVIGERVRSLDPAAAPGEEQAVELPVVAQVNTQLGLREKDFFAACTRGDVASVRRILSQVNIDINMANRFGTPLVVAALAGRAGVVKELLSRPGIDVNLAGKDGNTPLYYAVCRAHTEVVGLLLGARGINANLAAPNGTTPLSMAAFLDHKEITGLLLAAPGIKVNVRDRNGETPLCLAMLQGKLEIVKLLLAAGGINVNLSGESNVTPLTVAAYNGWEEFVKLLLTVPDIDVNARKNDGASALICAAQFGFLSLVDLLIKHGADVNLPLQHGATPLCIAAKNGHIEVIRLLLQAPGIRVNQTTDKNTTALSVAAQYGRKDIARALLGKGADPNLANVSGMSPLHFACLRGDSAIVQMLLYWKADSNALLTLPEEESYTPYELAQLGNHRHIMTVLAALRTGQEAPALEALSLADRPGPGTPPSPSPEPLPPPLPLTPSSPSPEPLPSPLPPSPDAVAAPETEQPPAPEQPLPDSQPAAERTLSALEQGKHALIREILYKLDQDTLDHLEGVRMMALVRRTDSIDALCGIYNRLAGIERQRQRAKRRRACREEYAMRPKTEAPEQADTRFALGAGEELDADTMEAEIRGHLGQAYHRFVSQVVNDMEFGRGKPTAGYPDLWHASAGVAGIGSCSVFYYLDAGQNRIRVVGIGHHVGRAAYRLDYATGELGSVGRILRIA